MNKYDLLNQHGAMLCHAYGCRKHKKLYPCFRGFFCQKHKDELMKIRQAKGNEEDTRKEIEWRLEELRFRKILDEKHIFYLNTLQTK
jgi:hypothetical protein